MFTDLRPMRLLCGLRQVDLALCTGVSVSAIAAAEQGRKPLNCTQRGLVTAYLNARWEFLQSIERQLERRDPVELRQY